MEFIKNGENQETTGDENILDLIFQTCEKHTFSSFSDIEHCIATYIQLRENLLQTHAIRDIEIQNTLNIFTHLLQYPQQIITPNGISLLIYDEGVAIQGECLTTEGKYIFLCHTLQAYSEDATILPGLLSEMQSWQKELLGKINHIKDNRTRTQKMMHSLQVQDLQKQLSGTLLLPNTRQDNDIAITSSKNCATHADFLGIFFSIDAYNSFIYAQKPEYLANIILGFDPTSGTLLTSEQKTTHFGTYFNPHATDGSDDKEDDEEVQYKSKENPQIPFPTIEDDRLYADQDDTVTYHEEHILNERDIKHDIPQLEIYNEPPRETAKFIEIPDDYSPMIRDKHYLSTQRIQTVDISKLDPSSLLYTLAAPLANNIKQILTDVETIEQSLRYYDHVQNEGLHDHPKFKQLYNKRKNKYTDTHTLNHQEIWNKYHNEVMEPFELQLEKKQRQKYTISINNIFLPEKINKELNKYMHYIETITVNDHLYSRVGRIQEEWEKMGEDGKWFFTAMKSIYDQNKKDIVYLGREIFGESFNGLPRVRIDWANVIEKQKKNPELNEDDLYAEAYGRAIKFFIIFQDYDSKFAILQSRTQADFDAFIDTIVFLEKIKLKKITELYDKSPKLLAQHALQCIELLLKNHFKIDDIALGSIMHTALLERISMRANTYFSGLTSDEKYQGKRYNSFAIGLRFMVEEYNVYLEKYQIRVNNNEFLKKIQNNNLPLRIIMDVIEILSATPEQLDKQGLSSIIDKEVNELYTSSSFTVGTINYITTITEFAHKYHIPLLRPLYKPLEQYAIHRIRRPESGDGHYSNELFFNRYSGTSGYEERDLGNTSQLLALLQDIGSPLTLSDILSLEYRSFANIAPETWIDIHETVPVQVGLPFVDVQIQAFRDSHQEAHARYILSMHPDTKQYTLRIDGTAKNASFLQHKHHIYDEIILGGGRAHLFHDKGVIELSHRIDAHGAEPRILTATACVNALNKALPITNTSRKAFLGDDGYVKMEDYF